HRSKSPNVLTSYAFHPAEALLLNLYTTLHLFIFPTHPVTVFVFGAFTLFKVMIGHSGHEIFADRYFLKRPLSFNTAVLHHDLHHLKGRGNYGLFFTWWDRLLGTEIPEYKQQYKEYCLIPAPGRRVVTAALLSGISVATVASIVLGAMLRRYWLA
ncbi:MAG: sterol desaturase family protein, partial [Pseudomonadota bacterium]